MTIAPPWQHSRSPGSWFHRTFRNPSFKSGPFIPPQAPQDESAALRAELTHKQLRELVLELDKAGFSEANLATAWREMTNQDIAARIVGYIRQPPLAIRSCPSSSARPRAAKLLASRQWTTPQRQWLQNRRPDQGQHARRPRRAG